MEHRNARRGSRVARLGTAVMLLFLPILAACGAGQAVNDTFGLSAAPVVKGRASASRQILVPEPTALKALDSEQIVVRLSSSEIQYLARSQWSDRLPRMVQSALVRTFENTGRVGGVGKPGEGLAIDFQVITDIRAFEVATDGRSTATVEIFAKIVDDRNGTVKAQRLFRALSPVSGSGNAQFVRALDQAFSKVAAEIVDWTLGAI
ncbi:ABC-type transport auxiliary lipoprotein family protein [Ensifer soli]|uniref:ABC-type transport auxiliary lipoprotein family protein n=1 Tax=Ciceribacter sp. sgz301302 TaxID=3342379 RepID=UPI0035BA72AE